MTPAPSSFDPATRIGTVVGGKYRLERLLGAGGMGAVYEAVHTGVQRRFAVKVMTSDPTRSPEATRRFTQEAQAAGLIGHPHIVEVFDLGESNDGSLYMVMELLRGETLHEVLKRGPLAQGDAVAIALELLRALDAAHKAGIIHRDIKPQNLFLAERPGATGGGATLKVLDFGIAKFHEPDASTITKSGSLVGTPLYMAPEQVLSDRELDGRVDVWAAGATLFEMLAGRPVHLAPHAAAAAVRIVTEAAPRVRTVRSDVDSELDDIIARALSIAREERFASAADMITALENIVPRLPAVERPIVTPSLPPRLPSSGALRQTPVGLATPAPTPAQSTARRTGSKNGLLLVGALALAGGATAGVLLLPPPTSSIAPTSTSTSPLPSPSPSPSPSTSTSTSATASGGSLATPTASMATLPLPLPSTLTSTSTSPSPSTVTSPSPSASGASLTERPKPVHVSKPQTTKPATSASASPAAPQCGPREVLSDGHCCPLGMVWQKDRCDRPVATTFK